MEAIMDVRWKPENSIFKVKKRKWRTICGVCKDKTGEDDDPQVGKLAHRW